MRKLFKSFLFITLLLSFITAVSANIQVPTPQENTWVHDYANVISDAQEQAINEKCDELDVKGYAQLNIVTVEFLDGNSVTDYGTTLFNEWGIGDEESNNGVLILLSVGDRELGFMQGKGLETILPSSDLGTMADEVAVPLMSEDNYADGLVAYADAIHTHLMDYHNDDEVIPSEPVSDEVLAQQYYDEFMDGVKKTLLYFVLFVVFIVVAFQFILFATARFGRRYHRPYVDSRTIHHGRPVHRHTSSSRPAPRPSRSFSSSSSRSSSPSRSSSSRSSSRSNGGGSTRGSGGSRKF
ncbi:MAG: TPM domain-containing protein [Erysipelotrichaceae bacterium]|nr:TPM domain-containing protein [Erysipelotrichaceae bacterium]